MNSADEHPEPDPERDAPPESLPPPTMAASKGPEGMPARVGRYTLRRRIASGGMGSIYEGIQDEPRRTVAIKLIRADVATPEAYRRFQFEAQILARLRHPAIAQIYEAGTHDDGSGPIPFFAMEYIPNARSITDYARDRGLGLAQRVELFVRVCDAVHHGHQRSIVHRDLKPSNILVDSNGDPHVIDFGVARATDSDMALATHRTEVGQLIGTLAYMSPEQFEADPHDLDTRSDIYSLGVVLYELLGGTLPYDVLRTKVYDAARVVREEPPRPLRVVSPEARGDLETIVHKAIEKDRNRRYQSASGLAEDLRRYLAGQAIAARPPSAGYQLRVFARRHKPLLAAASVVVVLLLGAAAVSTSLYFNAERERVRAEREAQRSRSAYEFMTRTLASIEPESFDHQPTLLDLVDRMSESVEGAFPGSPGVEADIRRTIAWGYVHQERWRSMEYQLSKALELRRMEGGDEDPKTMAILKDLTLVYEVMGESERKVAARQALLAASAKAFGERDRRTLSVAFDLAEDLAGASRLEESWSVAERTREFRRATLGPEHEETLRSEAQLGWLLLARGDAAASQARNQSLLDTSRRVLGEESQITRRARSQLAAALVTQGKIAEAKSAYSNLRVPSDLGVEKPYQGAIASPRRGARLLVFWETWCPYSQRTVPKLEQVHVRNPSLEIVGLTATRPPSTDERVRQFIAEKHLTFAVAKTSRAPWEYFRVPGTPWIVVTADGEVVWESAMSTPDQLLDGLLQGLSRGSGK